ncbi:MAG: TMEM175 family protein [Micropruina sp.]|uniref:TMEM175 family protein n=1 Tax=Micropruina sp. TaxID=2737536 RepID=UPI0039E6C9F0
MDAAERPGADGPAPEQQPTARLASAERLKAFTDAVVAIAMTLLILPLMESVSEVAKEGGNAGDWVADNGDQLFSFALSFVLIAAFWLSHHRLFDRVHRVDGRLLVLTVVWMFTIVWLPVATAIVGQMHNDPVQKTLYIGSLFATSVVMTGLGWYALRHPELHDMPRHSLRSGILADAIASVLFALAYLSTIAMPALSYYPMILLAVTGPLHSWLRRYLPG